MQAQTQTEPLPQDYAGWPDDFSDRRKKSAFLTLLRLNSRAIWIGAAGLGAILILGYCLTRNSSDAIASSPGALPTEKVNQATGRSSSDLEAFRAALSEQNATNQQLVIVIDALRAEQQEMRKQIAAAVQAAKQSAGITGSISSPPQAKAAATKKAEQADARQVPYPAPPRQVPYPRSN